MLFLFAIFRKVLHVYTIYPKKKVENKDLKAKLRASILYWELLRYSIVNSYSLSSVTFFNHDD